MSPADNRAERGRAQGRAADGRQNQIMQWLRERSLGVEELGRRLQVSTTTIQRDLDALIAQRRLRRLHRGAVEPAAPLEVECGFCHGWFADDSHTATRLHLADGRTQPACCPHCGLLSLIALGPRVASAQVTDFLTGQVLDVRQATYVVDADLKVCCRPTTLTFADRDSAARFSAGFGGQVLTLDEALHRLRGEMWH